MGFVMHDHEIESLGLSCQLEVTLNLKLVPSCLACVAGARKGKGEEKIGRARNARSEGEGKRKRLQPAHCLFGLSRSPTNGKSALALE